MLGLGLGLVLGLGLGITWRGRLPHSLESVLSATKHSLIASR